MFKYFLNSALAILVLLMTVGVSYSSISCPKGKIQKSCCAKEQITCCTIEITDNCCYEETLELQFNFDTPIEKRQEVPDFLPLFTETLHRFFLGFKQQHSIPWVYDLPPPKRTLENLSILQVYRL